MKKISNRMESRKLEVLNTQIFCCISGSVSEFRKKFENPILKGRDSEASDVQKHKGEEKLAEVRTLQF